MSRRLNFGRMAAAAALAITGAIGFSPRSVASVQASVQQNTNTKDTTAPVTSSVTAPAAVDLKLGLYSGFGGVHPVWIGQQKRGNRRNRSRFNYNR